MALASGPKEGLALQLVSRKSAAVDRELTDALRVWDSIMERCL